MKSLYTQRACKENPRLERETAIRYIHMAKGKDNRKEGKKEAGEGKKKAGKEKKVPKYLQ